MNINSRRKLKELLLVNQTAIQVVGAHNALGAKLVENAGFDAVWASGLEISAAQGKPDANILTLTEFVDVAKQMSNFVDIPVIADCDTGFGDLNNVIRTVEEYEQAGVAAICIEDKTFPKTNSFVPGRQNLEDIRSFCEKIIAAQNTKRDPDFLFIARIESFIAGEGLDIALERAYAYKEAGADMILIHSKQNTSDEVFAFSKLWNGELPLAIVPTTYPSIHVRELKDNNIDMAIYANQGLRTAIKAVEKMLTELRISGSISDIDDYLCDVKHIFEIQGMNKMISNELLIKDKVNKMFNEIQV